MKRKAAGTGSKDRAIRNDGYGHRVAAVWVRVARTGAACHRRAYRRAYYRACQPIASRDDDCQGNDRFRVLSQQACLGHWLVDRRSRAAGRIVGGRRVLGGPEHRCVPFEPARCDQNGEAARDRG
jgi:hypothetical protein